MNIYELLHLVARIQDLSEQRKTMADQLWVLEHESSKLMLELLRILTENQQKANSNNFKNKQ